VLHLKKAIVCCFVGHHPQDLSFGFDETNPDCIKLKEVLKDQIVNMIETFKVTNFISGIELGVEQYAAELVITLKAKYPHITLECAIPSEEQAINWSEPQRDRYFTIIERCDREVLLQGHYTEDCIKKRNEYMVKQSTYILAIWNGNTGRTSEAVAYARSRRKHVIIINPQTFEARPNIHIWVCRSQK
jgi:uncharacterized phage-like protein YoqJ